MLSSMAQTSETLETSAPNQLSASENEAGSKCSWAQAISSRSMPMETRTGPMVKAFSTPALVEPLGHGLFRVGLLQAAHGGQIATAESVFEQISHALELGGGLGLAAVAQAELLQAQQIFAQLRGGALGGGAGIVSSCIRPAARVPSETSFSRCSASTW